jgi:murein DD-endopeptidase MepM/ murein hydrolase activator NlpD
MKHISALALAPPLTILVIGLSTKDLTLPKQYEPLARSVEKSAPSIGGPEAKGRTEAKVRQTFPDLLQRKEEILRRLESTLEKEKQEVTRERTALLRTLIKLRRQGEGARAAPLEQRLRELTAQEEEIQEASSHLKNLARDRQRFEELLAASYEDERGRREQPGGEIPQHRLVEEWHLSWPVLPRHGISATYHDEGYEERFGIKHEAIDIPVAQGTPIRAPADGVVMEMHDRGYGYSTVTIEHEKELTTLFGHVSTILVEVGEKVRKGQVIALSGGRPGSRGAGLLTTGPHVHFELHAFGYPIDPLYVLPPIKQHAAIGRKEQETVRPL